MGNPFETIDTRLANIECLLIRLEKSQSAQPTKVETDKYHNLESAAKFLDLKRPTMYGLTSKRIIPSLKRGKRVYFKESDLKAWLEEGRRKSISQIQAEAQKITSSPKHKTIVS